MKKLLVLLLVILGGCSDDTSSHSSACGTVNEGELYIEIDDKYGDGAKILGVPAPNLVSVLSDSGQSYLVQLHGITAEDRSPAEQNAAINKIKELGASSGFVFIADEDCDVRIDSSTSAQPGQLFTSSGLSFSEELLLAGLVDIDFTRTCGSDLLYSCYSSLLLRD